MTVIVNGETLLLTHGEYSDYGVVGIYLAVIDFDINEWSEVYKAAAEAGDLFPSHFGQWLASRGLISEITYREVNTGSSYRVLTLDVDKS